MASIKDRPTDALRCEALEALAVTTDKRVPQHRRERAHRRWKRLSAELVAREEAAAERRRLRLVRGY
jgi:hypothetical protein